MSTGPSPQLQKLIHAFTCLPGVGPKSAQRMVLHLLRHDRKQADFLAKTLAESLHTIQYCSKCRTLSEMPVCAICSNEKRNTQQLCIVESPADILAIEQTASYSGHYFVLNALLSPIDGIGPEDIGADLLKKRFSEKTYQEVILALNPTVEGQATSLFIAAMVKSLPIRLTRIAHGIPLGCELEYTDGSTLAHALLDRTDLVS